MTLPVVFTANGQTGYNLTNSLRFRASATANLQRTPATTTSQTTWTWSGWVKRGSLGTVQYLFGTYPASGQSNSTWIEFGFYANNTLAVGGWTTSYRQTTQVFRDPSAWYHIVLAIDSTQATASNRVRLYVNGAEITAFTTNNNPSSSQTMGGVNSTVVHCVANSYPLAGTNPFDGYIAENNFIDGQQLTPSSFGSTNSTTGVWQPAKYTGTYGTNGFYLPFLTSSASYAGSFNGTNQLISAPANAVFNFTGNFTAECWANTSTITNATQPTLFTIGSDGGGLVVGFYAGTFYCYMLGSGGLMSAATLPLNQWVHVAWVRVGSTNTLYINGIASATATISGTLSSTGGVTVGKTGSSGSSFQYFQGLVSNFRVNNTAVYTSNFTPPTSALTAISGTQLLTLQNATIIDNSTNAFTITNTNSVTTSSANPFTYSISQDRSGNGNNWTPNNISLTAGSTYDSMTDVPTLTSATTANYCVLNPLDKATSFNVTGGNLNFAPANTSDLYSCRSTIQIPSTGKWIWEVTNTNSAYMITAGLLNGSTPTTGQQTVSCAGMTVGSIGTFFSTTQWMNTTTSWSVTNIGNGDTLVIAYDADAGKIWFGRVASGGTTVTWYNTSGTADPSTGTDPRASGIIAGGWFAGFGTYYTPSGASANFGQRPFAFTNTPTGFVALNTFNLPNSTIVKGNKVMDATLYTGNGSTQTITNAAPFKPDLVWIKSRSNAYYGALVDSVRGVDKYLYSALTVAEETQTTALSSFNSNGFSLAGAFGNVNANGATYVGWQWQAGQGSSSSNTSGSITSTVSVNASAGFSVVTYTGNATNGATVGHGLGVSPAMIITKVRSTTGDWWTWQTAMGDNVVKLNTTAAQVASTGNGVYNTASFSSSVFALGSGVINGSGSTFVSYCWAEIAGFSKFGSYVGNGSTDGTFVYTGFKPKYFMWKRSSGVGDWLTQDTSRSPYNLSDTVLYANYPDAEGTGGGYGIDILSNGIKFRNLATYANASGSTYIFMAFAENPFKNALAR